MSEPGFKVGDKVLAPRFGSDVCEDAEIVDYDSCGVFCPWMVRFADGQEHWPLREKVFPLGVIAPVAERDSEMSEPEFKVGDKVEARFAGYLPWGCAVVIEADYSAEMYPYKVLFNGEAKPTWIRVSDIRPGASTEIPCTCKNILAVGMGIGPDPDCPYHSRGR
jgi:hypothetical protein